jgi:hypothetical protein
LRGVGFIAPKNFQGIDLIVPIFLKNGKISCIKLQIKNYIKSKMCKAEVCQIFINMTSRKELKFSQNLIDRPSLSLIFQFYSYEDIEIRSEQVIDPNLSTFFRKRPIRAAAGVYKNKNVDSELEDEDDEGGFSFSFDLPREKNEYLITEQPLSLNANQFRFFKIIHQRAEQESQCSYGIASFGLKVFQNIKANSLNQCIKILFGEDHFTNGNFFENTDEKLYIRSKLRSMMVLSYPDDLALINLDEQLWDKMNTDFKISLNKKIAIVDNQGKN